MDKDTSQHSACVPKMPQAAGARIVPNSPEDDERNVGVSASIVIPVSQEDNLNHSRNGGFHKCATSSSAIERKSVPPKTPTKKSITLFSDPARFFGNMPRGWIESLPGLADKHDSGESWHKQ
ncbi:hypothetical protein Tcan_03299 [Toxocara canis]|uniref:Uncharacterized protein n=1 Tax=Toxocara canis TaxID=6265 RepID=A0A0B2V1V0_TOXCA|nr:hypothetical protein Tcan_03299 [Toxocara canis]